jgi:hypothetical protein
MQRESAHMCRHFLFLNHIGKIPVFFLLLLFPPLQLLKIQNLAILLVTIVRYNVNTPRFTLGPKNLA